MNVTELKARRREASAKAKITRDATQHELLRRQVIRLTREIKAAQA